MSARSQRHLCLVALAAFTLVGAACASESSSPPTAVITGSSAPATTGAPASSEDPAATTLPPRATTPATTPATSAGDTTRDCVAGTWEVGSEQIEHIFDGSPLTSMPGFTFQVSGSGIVHLNNDGTYHYEPAFNAEITVQEMTGTASWSGTLDGTWEVAGDQLVMSQTDNQITAALALMGNPLPAPSMHTFEGTATLLSCEPMTLSYRLDSPAGPIVQTLVFAG